MDPLLAAAIAVRQHAIATYSKFRVGAALEGRTSRIWTGCNIENVSYGLTVCAERVALFKALSEGERQFRRMAVATDTDVLAPPCGACRQLIWEFCGDIELILVNLRGKTETFRIAQLFPRPFDVSSIS